MAVIPTRFTDGEGYERMMGRWSRLAGETFLDWLARPSGLRWLDVGCGNGAFTALLVERCAPAEVQGIDPSEGQFAFARGRAKAGVAEFRQGDAQALPAVMIEIRNDLIDTPEKAQSMARHLAESLTQAFPIPDSEAAE